MKESIDYAIESMFGDISLETNIKRWNGKGKEFNGDKKLIYEGELF